MSSCCSNASTSCIFLILCCCCCCFYFQSASNETSASAPAVNGHEGTWWSWDGVSNLWHEYDWEWFHTTRRYIYYNHCFQQSYPFQDHWSFSSVMLYSMFVLCGKKFCEFKMPFFKKFYLNCALKQYFLLFFLKKSCSLCLKSVISQYEMFPAGAEDRLNVFTFKQESE